MSDMHWQGWHAALADLMADEGTPEPSALIDALRHLAQIDAAALLAYRADESPLILFCDLEKEWRRNTLAAYRDGAYLFDPFFLIQQDSRLCGLYRLSDIMPANFRRSGYYLTYYSAANVGDEVNLLTAIDDEVTVALVLERSVENRRFSKAELNRLQIAYPVVAAMLTRTVRAQTPRPDAHRKALFARLEQALQSFGTSVLTPREAEVLQLLMRGYATRSISERLGISPGTVKVHRRHIYEKLDITSQAELLPLFISTLSHESASDSPDLLAALMTPARATRRN